MASLPSQRRFTLIELLVVVAIIAILAAMLLPALTKAKSAAHVSVCQSNTKNHALALVAYAEEWDGALPYAWNSNDDLNYLGSTAGPMYNGYGAMNWSTVLLPYLQRDVRIFKCPGYVRDGGSPEPYVKVFPTGNSAVIYSHYKPNGYLGSFGYGFGAGVGGCGQWVSVQNGKRARLQRIGNPAETVSAHDTLNAGRPYGTTPSCAASKFTNFLGDGDRSNPGNYVIESHWLPQIGFVHFPIARVVTEQEGATDVLHQAIRSYGRASINFFDGHTELCNPNDPRLIEDTTDRYWKIGEPQP